MAITTWAATTGDWDDSKFSRAWDGPGMSPAKGDLTLSSSVPVGGIEYFISPGVANLEIVQSYEWDQLTSSWIDTAGDWSSGPVPQVAVGTGISPDKADLTFTAYSPTSGIMYDFRITAPTLTLTGQLPIDGTGFVISPDNATLTILQTYSWDNYGGTWANAYSNWDDVAFAPSSVETGQNQPDAASLTLTGTAPSGTIQKLWYVPVGSLALTGFVPISTTGYNFIPDSASLSGFGGGTLWDDGTGDWASHTEAWGLGTLTPTVGVTYTFVIDQQGNLVFTPYGSGWPLVSDPTYISEIIMS
ncbi:MAG: hypothetical protein QF535_07510 [Anaerolineales bacterium]|jgi:hypothetical protein|nr:hypothetical protein [Anaerolineales bacterium]